MDSATIIQSLSLAPHPEGGWYRQTWVADNPGRPNGTAILFLLQRGEVSHWHTVDATEIWFYHAGSPWSCPARPLKLDRHRTICWGLTY